jgi:hypothetical protein
MRKTLKRFQSERASRVQSAMTGVADYGCIADLLADIRHFCDVHGLDYEQEDQTAYGHYLAELPVKLDQSSRDKRKLNRYLNQ